LDWKKLHNDIIEFAAKHAILIEESDTTFVGGRVTTYQLNEGGRVYFELKHAKTAGEYGSKLRIYAKSTGELTIKAKAKWIGKPSIKTDFELTDKLHEMLCGLSKKVGSFLWSTEHHHSGWPSELEKTKVLKFECKQIKLATAQLENIRELHLKLLKVISNR